MALWFGIPDSSADGSVHRNFTQARIERYPEGSTSTNVAVCLTERIALRKFLRSSFSHLLFLKADVAFTEDFEDVVREAMSANADLVYLGRHHIEASVPAGEGILVAGFLH
ncbi:hypothetical protein N9A94_06325 [Akkermansiaceae bacterium]|nr:hypothetical protein [Akkermansiaceae bacterium]